MMLFSRYRRLVPEPQRRLIGHHRLPKPNWYVGSAEGSSIASEKELRWLYRDPAFQARVEEIERAIDRRT